MPKSKYQFSASLDDYKIVFTVSVETEAKAKEFVETFTARLLKYAPEDLLNCLHYRYGKDPNHNRWFTIFKNIFKASIDYQGVFQNPYLDQGVIALKRAFRDSAVFQVVSLGVANNEINDISLQVFSQSSPQREPLIYETSFRSQELSEQHFHEYQKYKDKGLDGNLYNLLYFTAPSLITDEKIDALINNKQHINDFQEGIETLKNYSILESTHVGFLLKHVRHAKKLATGLVALNQAGLDTPQNINVLIFYAAHPDRLVEVLVEMQRTHLLTQDNFRKLRPVFMQYPQELAFGLRALKPTSILYQSEILTQDNFDQLIKQTQYIKGLSHCFMVLQQVFNLNQNIFNLLIANAQYAHELGNGFAELLQQRDALTSDTFDLLIANAQHAESFAKIVKALLQADIFNNENLNLLQQHPQSLSGITKILETRIYHPLTQDIFEDLVANCQHAESLGNGLKALQRGNILNDNNIALLRQHPQHADGLGNTLVALHLASILSDANRTALINLTNATPLNASPLNRLARALSTLANGDELTQLLFDNMLASPKAALLIAYNNSGVPNKDSDAERAFNNLREVETALAELKNEGLPPSRLPDPAWPIIFMYTLEQHFQGTQPQATEAPETAARKTLH